MVLAIGLNQYPENIDPLYNILYNRIELLVRRVRTFEPRAVGNIYTLKRMRGLITVTNSVTNSITNLAISSITGKSCETKFKSMLKLY